MEMPIAHRSFWRRFVSATNTTDADTRYAGSFDDINSQELTPDELEQILGGSKTASSGLLAEFRASGRRLPREHDLTILLDEAGRPVAVIETLELTIEKFAEVDDSFARAHGAGQSLKSWRRHCRASFAARARTLGAPFGEDTELVCHRFRVVFDDTAGEGDGAAMLACNIGENGTIST
jgi:uncharacterized protein YhfF